VTDGKHERPDLTIVGGQPHGKRQRNFRGKIKVPVGLEKALFHAARDDRFKARLLADPQAAISEQGIALRPSEAAILTAISPAGLETMIAGIVPHNPKRRRFMGLVTAAAASLAAGTVASGCGDDDDSTVDTDTMEGGVDAGANPDTDTVDTDTVDTDNPDTDLDGGAGPDAGLDGSF
jgi:hypothetical protein